MAAWLAAAPESLLAAMAGATTVGVERGLGALLGERVRVGSVARDGARVVLTGVRVPFAEGAVVGEVVVDATLGLPRRGVGASGLEHARARVVASSPAGGLEVDLEIEIEGEPVRTPGVVWSGSARAHGRLRAGARHVPLELRAGVLVDADRAWLHGLEVGAPGVELRGDVSLARDGIGLRGRAAGSLRPAALLETLGAPRATHPAPDAALLLAITLAGSLRAPEVELVASAPSFALPLGRPRFVPPSRLEEVEARVTLGSGGLSVVARARAGEGRLVAELRGARDALAPEATVAVNGWPLRFFDGVLPLPPESLAPLGRTLAAGSFDGRLVLRDGAVTGEVAASAEGLRFVVAPTEPRRIRALDPTGIGFELEADLGALGIGALLPLRSAGLVSATGRVSGPAEVELRVTSRSLRAEVGGASAVEVDALDAVVRLVLDRARRVTVSVAPATVRALGGSIALEAEVRLSQGEAPAGEVRARLEELDERALEVAALAAESGLRIVRAPSARGEARPAGTAWLPSRLTLSGDVRVMAPATVHVELSARSAASDVRARARVVDGQIDARIEGVLAIAEAIDLGLFDGGNLPRREGEIDLALTLGGPASTPRLEGLLRAATLRFAPHVELEDVEALVSAAGGVAVWGEARARLAGGRVVLAALVDREGDLGGMRAHVELVDVDLDVLSKGLAHGRLDAEIALEQHGHDDAPLHGHGVVVVRGGGAPSLAQRLEGRLPAGLAARNAVARGDVSARLSLDPSSLRLLDLTLPLQDAWIGGDVRLGFEGAVEAHLGVHARGLVAVPVRLRGKLGDEEPTVEIDVASAALVGFATARARAEEARRRRPAGRPARHRALDAAVAAVDWAGLARRGRRPA